MRRKFGFVMNRWWVVRWLAVLAPLVVLGALWRTDLLAMGPTLCPFRLVTGLPCPGCGSTRAVGAFAAGDFSAAMALNPFGVAFAVAAALYVLNPRLGSAAAARCSDVVARTGRLPVVAAVVVAYALLWTWNVGRW